MSTTLTLEDLIKSSGMVVINDVEVHNSEFRPAGDLDCAVFHMVDEETIFFDPDQQVSLEDGEAKIRVTRRGERGRVEVRAQFFTLEKLTVEKALAHKAAA
jgi:hypothetical protein